MHHHPEDTPDQRLHIPGRSRAFVSHHGDMTTKEVLAEREHRYKVVALWVIFRALTDHREKWMELHPGEVLPSVLEAVPNERVVWSSFWPVSPDDTIELDLRQDGLDAILRFRWLSSAPPDERGLGITRHRLNVKFGGDMRGWLASKRSVEGGEPPSTSSAR